MPNLVTFFFLKLCIRVYNQTRICIFKRHPFYSVFGCSIRAGIVTLRDTMDVSVCLCESFELSNEVIKIILFQFENYFICVCVCIFDNIQYNEELR